MFGGMEMETEGATLLVGRAAVFVHVMYIVLAASAVCRPPSLCHVWDGDGTEVETEGASVHVGHVAAGVQLCMCVTVHCLSSIVLTY